MARLRTGDMYRLRADYLVNPKSGKVLESAKK
jgi:hypothetical protein